MMVWNLFPCFSHQIASVYRLPAELRNRAGTYPCFAWTFLFLLPRPMLAVTYELCYASQCCFCLFDKVDIKNSCCAKVSSLLQEENQFLF